MATVTGMTADAMAAIRDKQVVSAAFDSANHLILTKFDGTTIDGGAISDATATQSGTVELATSAETQTGTDATRAVTPAGLASIPGTKVQILTGTIPIETALPSAYPKGTSMMDVSGWSVGNGSGTVVTNYASDSRVTQTLTSASGGISVPRQWFRSANSGDGGGGWTKWQVITTNFPLVATSFTQVAVMASYPEGHSRLYYTSANSGSWDFSGMAGQVDTYYDSVNGYAQQTFTQHLGGSSANPVQWYRTSNASNGWTAWQKETRLGVDYAGYPSRMAFGQITITTVANADTMGHVTFPAGRFTAAPTVTLGLNTTAPGDVVQGISFNNPTATGVDIYIRRTNVVATDIHWMAVQA